MYQVDIVTDEWLGKTIHDFIKNHRPQIIKTGEYAAGNNPSIVHRNLPDDSGPDNRIPVSYALRIINLVTGYMYKPGLIQYAFDGSTPGLDEVFKYNKEPIKTSQMGKTVSTYGVGYEYHYVDGDGKRAIPRFVSLPCEEVIPIYDKKVEPDLIGFVRIISDGENLEITYCDDKQIVEYTMAKNGDTLSAPISAVPHYYKRVPLVVFENNYEHRGDFESVEPLIDAYDVLISDSMNEFDRFAWAYLLLKGMVLSGESAEKIKRMRIFENLEETADVAFLTKTIDTEFIRFMTESIRSEIHRQSGIPNLEDYDGAGASGKTLTKFIYLMELFTDPKEAYFKDGLQDRLDCINRILTIQGKGFDLDSVEIVMNRNRPDASKEQAEIFNLYYGKLSDKTLIENFADFVPDADIEMQNIEEENKRKADIYGVGLNDQGLDDQSNGNGEASGNQNSGDGAKA